MKSYSKLPKWRRFAQVFFFGIFLLHLLETEYRGSLKAIGGDARLPIPYSGIFLLSDPLIAILNALSTRALYVDLLWCLTILIPTFFLGRFFCGWICPLGTLNHCFGSLKSEKKRGLQLIESNRYKKWHNTRYYILVAMLIAAVFGVTTLTLMDPMSLLIRSMTISVLPALNVAGNAAIDSLYRSDNGVLTAVGHGLQFILSATILSFKQPHFRQGLFLGLILVFIMALNLRVTRFWCRALCPLGALLGAISRFSPLGLEKNSTNCDDCNRCLLRCQGGDDPIPGAKWRKSECHLCFNCVGECPKGGLKFKFFPAMESTTVGPQLQRRKVFTSVAAGVALLPVLRATTSFSAERDPRLIRPPGSLDEKDFLARCVRCGECMKVCPNNALHPSLTQAGLEGLWSPVVVPRVGYCEPSCTFCGQVCPTSAIWKITQAEKAWLPASQKPGTKPLRIGTAFYDHGRCLPWAMATECIVCEEWCPTSPKAIYLVAVEVVDSSGVARKVRQPHVDPDRCVGCGACEFACPVKDQPAVYVTSIGESRSRGNQLLLRRATSDSAAGPKPFFPDSDEVPGWVKSGQTRTFPADRLYEYIDGDADKYTKAGVGDTQTTDYVFNQKVEAVADVFVMSGAAGATEVFESNPAAGSQPAQVGDAARLYQGSLMFHKGRYFVRLVAYQDDPKLPEAMVALARAIAARL